MPDLSPIPLDTDANHRHDRRFGLVLLFITVLPVLAALGLHAGFVTQDGPAHLYNAQIISASLLGRPPYTDYYAVRWQPLPNWAGHLALMGLMSIVPFGWADKGMIALTFVGVTTALVHLRRVVAGDHGLPTAVLLAVILALNGTWLLGFYSFLMGVAVGLATLGVWWSGRDQFTTGRAVVLAVLLVLGYFCHLISLGLTTITLVILTATTPGPDRRRRALLTFAALLPLVPLGMVYRILMRGGGAIQPLWMAMDDWRSRLGWVDPISLSRRLVPPFLEQPHAAFVLLAPIVLVGLALSALAGGTILASTAPGRPSPLRERRGWALAAALFVLFGVVGPDTLGPNHGNFLAQRLFLFGLMMIVPLLDLGRDTILGRIGLGLLSVAVVVQSAYVWDYAGQSHRQITPFLRARAQIEPGQRIAGLFLDLRQKFRANPLLHADNLLGVGTGGIVWSNYEAGFYYFPVQVRPGLHAPPPLAFERVSVREYLNDEQRARLWSELLRDYHDQIDVLAVWDEDPDHLDPITNRYFHPQLRDGRLRLLRPRAVPEPAESIDRVEVGPDHDLTRDRSGSPFTSSPG